MSAWLARHLHCCGCGCFIPIAAIAGLSASGVVAYMGMT